MEPLGLKLFCLETHQELRPDFVPRQGRAVGAVFQVFQEPRSGGGWHECPLAFAINFPHLTKNYVRQAYLSPVSLGPQADAN